MIDLIEELQAQADSGRVSQDELVERAADKLGVDNWTVTNDVEKIMMKGELLDKDGGDIRRIK